MRNLAILQDHLHALEWENIAQDSHIVSLTCNHAANKIYVLHRDGKIVCFEYLETLIPKYSLQLMFDDTVENWFRIDYIPLTSSIVCISAEGSIVTFEEENELTPTEPDQIGVIDGGVATAKWHPDYSSLLLITNNHTLLCMSNTWDVVSEIDIPKRNLTVPIDISWKGDGELFSIVSTDAEDGISRVRIYNSSHFELLHIAQNVAQEGAAAVMKGVGHVTAFATNGSYIAVHQKKVGTQIEQVALIEKNGSRHGDFDLRNPPVREGYNSWNVVYLQWDLTSTLLAVAWKSTSSIDSTKFIGCVQLYYRENFFWYCKQQLLEEGLIWLGFDPEKTQRCYCSQSTTNVGDKGDEETSLMLILRIIDWQWEMAHSSGTRDGSVSVVDGSKLYLTPLGYHSIPPPMSMHTLTLAGPTGSSGRYVSYWSKRSISTHTWGMAVLVNDLGDILLYYGNERGQPVHSSFPTYSVSVGQLLYTILHGQSTEPHSGAATASNDIKYRRVVVTESETELWVYVVGSMISYHNLKIGKMDSSESNQEISDVVICLQVQKHALPLFEEMKQTFPLPVHSISIIDHVPGTITYATTVTQTTHSVSTIASSNHIRQSNAHTHRIVIGYNNIHSNDYEVHLIAPYEWINTEEVAYNAHQSNEVYMLMYGEDYQSTLITTVPEDCASFTVVTHTTAADSITDGTRQGTTTTQQDAPAMAVASESIKTALEDDTSVLATAATTGALTVTDISLTDMDGPMSSTSVSGPKSTKVVYTVIALSTRNRLYSNEQLLYQGISSYVYNPVAMILMFITLGTKPHLHYIPYTSLPSTTAFDGADERQHGESNAPDAAEEGLVIYECSEPRPVERGARLIASIAGDSKVIIQLPRGNLEIFEPRPMVLMQIQQALLHCQFLDALLLMRRQRIHMNYIVDFYPTLFHDELALFVQQIMNYELAHVMNTQGNSAQSRVSSSGNSNDLLSLLITAWINEDVTLTKYPMILPTSTLAASMANLTTNNSNTEKEFAAKWQIASIEEYIQNKVTFLQKHRILPTLNAVAPVAEDADGEDGEKKANKGALDGPTAAQDDQNKLVSKVNFFCEALRAILLQELEACVEKFHAISTNTEQTKKELQAKIAYLFYPILCTYAKQSPALIQDGLMFIKQYCIPSAGSTTLNATGTNLTAAIKYFHFLISSEELFTTALSMGEFVLCRAIGRQCQMDPKHYLPLIASFESIGEGYPSTHYQYLFMMYSIAKHVNSLALIYKYFTALLSAVIAFEVAYSQDTSPSDAEDITTGTIVDRASNLQDFIATKLNKDVLSQGLSLLEKSAFTKSLFLYLTSLEQQYAAYFPTTQSPAQKLHSITSCITYLFNPFRTNYALKLAGDKSITTTTTNTTSSVIQCYLTCYPPNYAAAVEYAVQQQEYSYAMTLIQQAHYLQHQSKNKEVSSVGTIPSVKQVVQQIVQSYQQQTTMYYNTNTSGSVEYSIPEVSSMLQDYVSLYYPPPTDILTSAATIPKTNNPGNNNTMNTAPLTTSHRPKQQEDKALFVANLLLTYTQDVETASQLLMSASHYAQAIQITRQYERYDLVEEIYQSIRQHCQDTMDYLTSQARQYNKYVDELNGFWQNPTERLEQIASVDSALQGFLKRTGGEEYADELEGNGEGVGDDTQSNYSAATRYSTLSIRSAMSQYSLLSAHSQQSSASSVSILSQLSSSTAGHSLMGTAQGGNDEDKTFRIEGLDHSLLSRGSVSKKQQFQDRQKAYAREGGNNGTGTGGGMSTSLSGVTGDPGDEVVCSNPNNPNAKPGKVYARDLKPRQQKRIERAKTKGYMKDIHNMKREYQLVEALFPFAQLTFYVDLIASYTQILSLTNTVEDHRLLQQLYDTFQRYVSVLQSKPVPRAPAYPKEWLVQRQYIMFYYYQDHAQLWEATLQKRVQYLIEHQAISSTTWEAKKVLLQGKEIALCAANIQTWWQIVEMGKTYWQEQQLLHYST